MDDTLTDEQRLARIEAAIFGDGTDNNPGLVHDVKKIMDILTKSTGGVAVLKALISLSVAISVITGTIISGYNILHNLHGGK